jgi:dihydroorotate dehydrogenase|tara:strand:- start:5869 stop:6771 length:903 start_codon:yes stop_codon:yes gene_type:complete
MFQFDAEPTVLDGLTYKNKVGLAAGFDKDGKFLNELNTLNFGFIEVGTVTPKPQGGNPKPRLFRLKKDRALMNRMGFNNEGLKALKARLQAFRKTERDSSMLIGINIGKNKNTPNENAVDDYVKCYEGLYDLADFFIVNVSSPNTPNLRELQNKGELKKILSALITIREKQDKWKPLYLKIAPDLTFTQLDEIIELQSEIAFEGLVATNTSIDRSLLKHSNKKIVDQLGTGGISGAPVLEVSNSFVKHIRSKSDMTVIGVGGIEDAASGKSKFDAGADLIEIYSGFVYSGPGLVKELGTI